MKDITTSHKQSLLSVALTVMCGTAALYALVFPLQDPDTFWHLAYGRAMLEQGRFINHEIFSYTAAGANLVSHSQLAQVVLYAVWLFGGANALLGFKVLVGLATFALVWRTGRLYGLDGGIAAIVGLGVVMAGLTRFVERPELFSILLQAALILLLFGYARGAYTVRALWVVPVLLVLWDYLHGALYGLVLLLVFVGAETLKGYLARLPGLRGWGGQSLTPERLKTLWLWSGIALVAMSLHPNGLLNYAHFFRVSSNTVDYAMFGEFMPTRFIPQFYWFWGCLFLTAGLLVVTFRRVDFTALATMLPFLYLALKFNRATLAFCLAAVPLLVEALAVVRERLGEVRWRNMLVLPAGALVLVSVPLYKEYSGPELFRLGTGLNENAYPIGSTRFVKGAGLTGNMFNTDGSGGYVAFYMAPERKIFNYNQPGIFTALHEYIHQPASRPRWNISYAIIAEKKEYDMFQRDGFVAVYWEPSGMVLLKPGPGNDALIAKYRIRHFDPLKSIAEYEMLVKDPRSRDRFLEEMSTYLTYRNDSRIAAFFGRMLSPTHSEVPIALERRQGWLESALRENPESVSLLLALGEICYRQQQLETAALLFDRVLAIDAENLAALLSRGYIDYDRQDYSGAARFFKKAVGVAGETPEPHYALGLAAMRLADRHLAQQEFERFLQLDAASVFAPKARRFLEQLAVQSRGQGDVRQ